MHNTKHRIGTFQILSTAVSMIIFKSKILGLMPFHLDIKKQLLTRYRFPILYPICFALLVVSALVYSYSVVMPKTHTQYNSEAIELSLFLIFISYSLNLVLIYVMHYIRLDVIEEIFVDSFAIIRILRKLKIQWIDPGWWLFALFMFNFIVNPLIQISITFIRLLYLDINSSEHYLLIIMISIPNFITSLVPYLFYSVLAGVYYALRVLNKEIRTIMMDSMALQKNSQFRIQQRFCELSDSLDSFSKVHQQVSQVAQRTFDILMVNLVSWIVFKACAMLGNMFTSYMYCLGWAQFDKFEMPIQILTIGLTSVFMTLMEMFMFAQMCRMTMDEVIALYNVYLKK